MAQLTDDCFAFSGPLMPVAEVERIIAERVSPVAEIEIRAARGGARPGVGRGRGGADQSAAVR